MRFLDKFSLKHIFDKNDDKYLFLVQYCILRLLMMIMILTQVLLNNNKIEPEIKNFMKEKIIGHR